MTHDELIESVLADYWSATSHAEEHAAVQRLLALGHDGGDPDAKPCPEPECVALREAMLGQLAVCTQD